MVMKLILLNQDLTVDGKKYRDHRVIKNSEVSALVADDLEDLVEKENTVILNMNGAKQ